MTSRREEERNEKIIRGLLKLPPNRRCINCDTQGPQYVCTNFWTFICITCSGIHREFTHRVKSVSMSKFSSQEVDALQKGGNQRAREVFLKNWDMQSQKLPANSNVNKIREFIKSVYVDKKYAGGRSTDKPPRDLQSNKSGEEEHRRASSYHSFSQSPPYDHQYEDRLYGKQNHMLTRKPGSERGLYDGKLASFLYSPGRKREEMSEDRFANEGSNPRLSDFSVSSSGEAFGSGVQSPNFQRVAGTTEPLPKPIREILIEDAQNEKQNVHPDTNIQSDGSISQPRPGGSFGSTDGKTIPSNSAVSVNLFDDVLGTVNPDNSQTAKLSVMPSQPSAAHTSVEDLFGGLVKSPSANYSAQSADLFAGVDATPLPNASSAAVDLFADSFHQTSCMPSSSQNIISVPSHFGENEGWAQFDAPQVAVSQVVEKNQSSTDPSINGPPAGGNLSSFLSSDNGSHWTSEQSVFPQKSTSVSYDGHVSTQANDFNPQVLPTMQWDAFDNSFGNSTQPSFEGSTLKNDVHPCEFPSNVVSHMGLEFFEDSTKAGLVINQSRPITDGSLHHAPVLSNNHLGGSVTQDKKSINPFDLPFESGFEHSHVFMDMASLQTALSNTHPPDHFVSNAGQPWFPPDHLLPYMPPVPSGYVPGPAPSSQLGDIPVHGPGSSLTGNPFAPQPPSPPLANISLQGAGPSISGNPFA